MHRRPYILRVSTQRRKIQNMIRELEGRHGKNTHPLPN